MIATAERTTPAHDADAPMRPNTVEADDLKRAVSLLKTMPPARGKQIVSGQEHITETVVIHVSLHERRLVFTAWDRDGNDCSIYIPTLMDLHHRRWEDWAVGKADLFGAVNAIPPNTTPTVSLTDDSIVFTTTGGRIPVPMKKVKADDYPDRPHMAQNWVQISVSDLREMLGRAIPFAAPGDNGHALNGIHLTVQSGKMTLVSCDTHRLGLDTCFAKHVIPIAGCTLPVPLAKLIVAATKRYVSSPVTLASSETRLWAVGQGWGVSGRLIDGRYPRYSDVIPDPRSCRSRAEVSALAMFTSVKAAARFAEDTPEEGPTVFVQWGAGGLTVAPNERRENVFPVPGEFSGEPGGEWFSARQLLEMLSVVPVDAAVLHVSDPGGPLRLDAGDYLHLLMPDKRRR